jgi:ketosteroid isomerase-like protein
MVLMDTPETGLERALHFFEHMQPADLAHLDEVYCRQALFKDPFNEVQGLQAIEKIFAHMFATLNTPRFVITQCVQQETECFVTWDFLFSLPRLNHGAEQVIQGASHLRLAQEDGQWRIVLHRDYWDAAQELYEKFPILGGFMRWLKRRVSS